MRMRIKWEELENRVENSIDDCKTAVCKVMAARELLLIELLKSSAVCGPSFEIHYAPLNTDELHAFFWNTNITSNTCRWAFLVYKEVQWKYCDPTIYWKFWAEIRRWNVKNRRNKENQWAIHKKKSWREKNEFLQKKQWDQRSSRAKKLSCAFELALGSLSLKQLNLIAFHDRWMKMHLLNSEGNPDLIFFMQKSTVYFRKQKQKLNEVKRENPQKKRKWKCT